VLRDNVWKSLSAAEIVPGDIVSLSLGGIIPADLEILHGDIQLDQSMLTGESATVSIGSGSRAYAGALVRRGEALGRVIATGPRTYFGRTADLVRIAHAESSEQKAVLAVVRNITVINGGILAAMTGYAHILGLPTDSVIKLALTAILASIPVALPATFTLAAAFSARVLARRGILLTHLEGVHEAASVDILCSDKTGTLTRNELSVTDIVPAPGRDRTDVLHLALMASSEDRGDPVDGAIREAALTANSQSRTYRRLSFVPFDPAFKQASADVETWNGRQLHVVKGAYATIAAHARPEPISVSYTHLTLPTN
jgi:H+-transporting ATPase